MKHIKIFFLALIMIAAVTINSSAMEISKRFISADPDSVLDLVDALLSQNFEAEILDAEFLDAVKKDKLEDACRLLMQGARVNAQSPSSSTSGLHRAVSNGNIKMLECLLATPGININIQTRSGYTALHYAVHQKNIVIIKKLLNQSGIDANTANLNKRTPLMDADSPEIIQLLFNHITYRPPHYEQIKRLSALRADAMSYFHVLPVELIKQITDYQGVYSISYNEAKKVAEEKLIKNKTKQAILDELKKRDSSNYESDNKASSGCIIS